MSTNKYDNQLKKKFIPLKRSITIHENRINAIVNEFLSTTRIDNAYWASINARLNTEYKAINKLTTKWAKEEIPRQYRFVLREQMAKAKSLKSITNKAKKTLTQLLKSNKVKQMQLLLAQSAIEDITTGLVLGRNDLSKLTRSTRQALIADSAIDKALIKSIEEGNVALSKILSKKGTVANNLLKANKNNRYLTIINKNGNPMKYRISYYSEMVYRVKWHEAQSAAVRTNNANYGTDLIRVSNHNTTTEICQQYEGKIFSLNGKNKDFPIIDQLAPFHVNCLHYETTVFAESLKVQGNYQEYSDFSKGKTDKPPGQIGFLPVEKRNKIVNKTILNTKKTDTYQKASPKGKRIIMRDNVGKAIGKAA